MGVMRTLSDIRKEKNINTIISGNFETDKEILPSKFEEDLDLLAYKETFYPVALQTFEKYVENNK